MREIVWVMVNADDGALQVPLRQQSERPDPQRAWRPHEVDFNASAVPPLPFSSFVALLVRVVVVIVEEEDGAVSYSPPLAVWST